MLSAARTEREDETYGITIRWILRKVFKREEFPSKTIDSVDEQESEGGSALRGHIQ